MVHGVLGEVMKLLMLPCGMICPLGMMGIHNNHRVFIFAFRVVGFRSSFHCHQVFIDQSRTKTFPNVLHFLSDVNVLHHAL